MYNLQGLMACLSDSALSFVGPEGAAPLVCI